MNKVKTKNLIIFKRTSSSYSKKMFSDKTLYKRHASLKDILTKMKNIEYLISRLKNDATALNYSDLYRSYDHVSDEVKKLIDNAWFFIHNSKAINKEQLKCIPYKEGDLLKHYLLNTLICLYTHYWQTAYIYNDTKSDIPQSFVDLNHIGYKIGVSCWTYYQNALSEDAKTVDTKIEPSRSDLKIYGINLLKAFLPTGFFFIDSIYNPEEQKTFNFLFFDIKKWTDFCTHLNEILLLDLPYLEEPKNSSLMATSYKRGNQILYEDNWKPSEDWDKLSKVLDRLSKIPWKINLFMLQFLSEEMIQVVNTLTEPTEKPLNPLSEKGKNEQVNPIKTEGDINIKTDQWHELIKSELNAKKELTKEEKLMYTEFKQVIIPKYMESVINYNKNIEYIMAIYTAQLLYYTNKCFYFRHRFDFRGRVYKVGSFNYDRGDLYRALLEFD